MPYRSDNKVGLRLIEKVKLMYIREIIEELKNNPELTLLLAEEEELTPGDYVSLTTKTDKNISYYDSTLKKIYTLKNKQNKNH